jgi:UDP-N-acetylmuramoyl-L-alanyl-D-glutamate--2,6-diaminopimelate ligase
MKTQKENNRSLRDVHNRLGKVSTLKELSGNDMVLSQGSLSTEITDLITDSRRVTPGSAFFAIPGLRTDGNNYLDEAIRRGAKTIISNKENTNLPAGVTAVKADNPRLTLAKFAKNYHGAPDRSLNIIGVTGTNGKTTVTALVRHLLERPGRPVGLLGTVKYHLGDRDLPSFKTTPEASDIYPLLRSMLVAGCSEAVMEVSSHGIHQDRVAGLELEVAAFLNLTRDHLDYHGNMESYFCEKRKIFNGQNGSLPKVAVINADCPYGRRLMDELPPHVHILSFGESDMCTFRAKNIRLTSIGSEFILEGPFGSTVVTSPLLGRYNVMNILAAFAIVHALGIKVSTVIHKINGFSGVDGRMEKVDRGQGYKVVVDYAHTPDALRNALSMLRECTNGKLHLVFGCGGDRDKGKRLEMTKVACAGADKVWATADNPRTENQGNIFNDMRKGISKSSKVYFIDDRRRAISMALDAAESEDCVLIAGKGHETFQEVQYTAIPFDDRIVAGELLSAKQLTM